jgi:hypothetical protein
MTLQEEKAGPQTMQHPLHAIRHDLCIGNDQARLTKAAAFVLQNSTFGKTGHGYFKGQDNGTHEG